MCAEAKEKTQELAERAEAARKINENGNHNGAIELYRGIVDELEAKGNTITSKENYVLGLVYNNCGASYKVLWRKENRLNDLLYKKAETLLQKATGTRGYPEANLNLVNLYNEKYDASGNVDYLRKAVPFAKGFYETYHEWQGYDGSDMTMLSAPFFEFLVKVAKMYQNSVLEMQDKRYFVRVKATVCKALAKNHEGVALLNSLMELLELDIKRDADN